MLFFSLPQSLQEDAFDNLTSRGVNKRKVRIRVFCSDPGPGILVGSGSEYFGQIRVRMFWSDPDPGILFRSGSGYFRRIWVVWSDPDPGVLVGS